jgi:hypothetical protein
MQQSASSKHDGHAHPLPVRRRRGPAEGEPVEQFYCHCDDCQAISGGAYVGAPLLPIKDELPHFKGLPAKFGGSDETLAW